MGRRKNRSGRSPPPAPSPDSTEPKVVVEADAEAMAKTLAANFDSEVRPLIDLIDKLRGFGLDSDINLPAVAVIGDQSAGKSSVLEAISGVQLPRGTGIVTRCPLEMRMKNLVPGSPWEGKISYTDRDGELHEERVFESATVGPKVRQAQQEMTDSEKGISDELITLEIKSPDVPDLTLIDLPGIARNAVEGQPYDIEFRIKSLIRKYIQRQETIILAVLQCNVDIATCEAIKMAREFDNEGCRTLGVLTKPDLLDRGAEQGIVRILNNVDFPLSKGYIIVKCRGQQAINEGQTLKDALQSEMEYFRTHAHFGVLPPSKWGITNLSRKLSRELRHHIRNLLPKLKEDVRQKLLETEHQLHELGADPPQTPAEKRQMALRMVTDFMNILGHITKGERYDDKRLSENINRLYSDARRCFKSFFEQTVLNTPDTTDIRLQRALKERMELSRGREFSNYMGKFEMVESIAREYVKKMERPAINCFDDVHDKTTHILKILAATCFEKFPDFTDKAKEVIHEIRTETQKDGREEIQRYFKMEELVYAQDTTYSTELNEEEEERRKKEEEAAGKQNQAQKLVPSKSVSRPDEGDSVMKAMMSLKSYYQVATRRMCDVIPMMIQLHVFREQVDALREDLMDLASDERIMEHICEDADMAHLREECKSRHQRLQLAEQELDKI